MSKLLTSLLILYCGIVYEQLLLNYSINLLNTIIYIIYNLNIDNSSASSLKDFWTKRFSLCFQKTNAINLLSQAGNLRFPSTLRFDIANSSNEDNLI
jgi:hypothetical protein